MANYAAINAAWPDPVPVPSAKEAITGTKRLIRKAFALAKTEGKSQAFLGCSPYMKRMRFKATSGRRYTYPRSGVWHVNPDGHHFGGWKGIVHGISHWAIRRFWPNAEPHSAIHAWMENELTSYAIANFLAGQLARPEKVKAPVDRKVIRAARVAARLARWEAKRKRADTAIRKLRRQAKHYERVLAQA